MEYLTVKEAGEHWNITGRMHGYTLLCCRTIPGAMKKGNLWLVPGNAEKPIDGRTKEAKNEQNIVT